jgi:hypothetical protein
MSHHPGMETGAESDRVVWDAVARVRSYLEAQSEVKYIDHMVLDCVEAVAGPRMLLRADLATLIRHAMRTTSTR